MPNYNASLDSLVVGDDYDVIRSVPNVPDGTTLSLGWLTIKKNKNDSTFFLQKKITPTVVGNVGQITDVGSTGTGEVVFQLTGTDTETLVARRPYFYDIQVKTATGKIYTVEIGKFIPLTPITTDIA